jgi:Uma2 family endonuclease
MASIPAHRFTEEEYLAIERAAEYKSEYVNGEIFAMAGGTSNHAILQSNVIAELAGRLGDRPCIVYTSEMRVRAPAARSYTYPDASVVCGKREFADDRQDTLLNPVVIVEVLSPSTEGYDRGRKFTAYRTIGSLKNFILVDQDAVLVECYSRRPDNAWDIDSYQQMKEELHINSIGVSIPLSRLYRNVELATSPTPAP